MLFNIYDVVQRCPDHIRLGSGQLFDAAVSVQRNTSLADRWLSWQTTRVTRACEFPAVVLHCNFNLLFLLLLILCCTLSQISPYFTLSYTGYAFIFYHIYLIYRIFIISANIFSVGVCIWDNIRLMHAAGECIWGWFSGTQAFWNLRLRNPGILKQKAETIYMWSMGYFGQKCGDS